MVKSICKSCKPERELLANRNFYGISKNERIRDVGNLIKAFVRATNLDCPFAIYTEIALPFPVFYFMFCHHLVYEEAFT